MDDSTSNERASPVFLHKAQKVGPVEDVDR